MASTEPAPLSNEKLGLQNPYDFSLVLGGPLFQLFRKLHLAGDTLELLHRRLIVITVIAYVPLVLLEAVRSTTHGIGRASFFQDIEVQVRLLIALPVLIGAEVIVHSQIRLLVRSFVERRLVLSRDLPRFYGAIELALRLRNSIPLELGLLLLVYTVGPWIWHRRIPLESSTWHAIRGSPWDMTTAGLWYVFVSIPIFQFILLRWYLRFFIWFRFLWQVSKIDLNLSATHPDRCGGLAFLGGSTYAFSPILFAQGAILAGILANRILHQGETLVSAKTQVIGFVAFFVIAILAPLVTFAPQMIRVRRKGLRDYGLLGQRYVEKFRQRWVSDPEPSEELLGTGDIQSLADLANSYAIVREMRPVPLGARDMLLAVVATAAPLVPLLFTIFSPEELIMRIIKVVF